MSLFELYFSLLYSAVTLFKASRYFVWVALKDELHNRVSLYISCIIIHLNSVTLKMYSTLRQNVWSCHLCFVIVFCELAYNVY